MSLLSSYTASLFDGVRPSWKRILLSPKIRPILDKCLRELEQDLIHKGVTREHLLENGLHQYIRPSFEHIFEMFKYFDAKNLRCIFMGQDPFPDKKDAHGLCFSSRSDKIPASTRNVLACLVAQGLIRVMPSTANLVSWAKQGFLLSNTCLTRTPNIVKHDMNGKVAISVEGNGASAKSNMHPFWAELSKALLEYISDELINSIPNRNVYILLWGNDAKALESSIKPHPRIRILKWGHPSPLNNANQQVDSVDNFNKCDHFKRILEEYPSINFDPTCDVSENLLDQFWHIRSSSPTRSAYNEVSRLLALMSPKLIYDDGTDTDDNKRIRTYIKSRVKNVSVPSTLSPVVIYVDGGCSGNHIKNNANAVGSYGVWFAPTYRGATCALGEIKISELLINRLMTFDKTADKIVPTGTESRCTNQRAELTAVIMAFQKLCEFSLEASEINLVTDSQQYIVSWMSGRLWDEYAKDPKLTKVANRDLVVLLCRYVWRLGRWMSKRLSLNADCDFGETRKLLDSGFLKIHHINSHLKPNEKASLSIVDREHSYGNEMADTLCNQALNGHTH